MHDIRFRDGVHASRLRCVEGDIHTPPFRQFTRVGIAWDAGFSSGMTFSKALQKHRGIVPFPFMETCKKCRKL